jgi:hypothetical protein
MKSIKKIATSNNINIEVHPPFNQEVVENRHKEYHTLSNIDFRKNYRGYIYEHSAMLLKNEEIQFQFNKCYNPFCKWYGLPQKKYENVKSKPSRYRLVSRAKDNGIVFASFQCNDLSDTDYNGTTFNHTNEPISNWSVAEEIKRLIQINTVTPVEAQYSFHKDGCSCNEFTPLSSPKHFYRKGKSSSNSQKYQCKECKKITNILPQQDESFNYHQKRNEILIDFTKDLLSRVPVKRTCEKLEIGSSTYYNKLEWLYRKCLEFLERHETKKLQEVDFENLWLNTDTLNYNLNNVKLKGKGGRKSLGTLDKKLATSVIATAELKSGYVLRSDVAYDFDITLEQIEEDTQSYHCDHTYDFLRKSARLRYSYAPQEPTECDIQSKEEYLKELLDFKVRKNYIEGSHVKTTYTAIAHYFLLKRLLNVRNDYYFVSDDDATLQAAIFRVFSDKFKDSNSIYFTCQADKSLSLEDAGRMYYQSRHELYDWRRDFCPTVNKIADIAYIKLAYDLQEHDFYEHKVINGTSYVTGKYFGRNFGKLFY